ncbi:hypothetical protein CPC08DRAFT_631893 [Agrocybe pediades]|nr:hypothetical protein CPC08DRAFT_631893 [Agrocybe pediades]
MSYEPDQSWWEPCIPFDDEASGQYGENTAENTDSSIRDIPDAAVAGGSGTKRKRSSSPSDDPPGPSHVYHPDEDSTSQGSSIDHKGKGKAREKTPTIIDIPDSPHSAGKAKEITKKAAPEPLSEYTCPICFGPPMNATLTPCGHISCGSCLFAAVKSALQRATYAGPGMNEARVRCPVCRAVIPGWDGKGAGVIGLKPRAIFRI